MSHLRTAVQVSDMNAYGTSEGVSKAWDSRGRGGQAAATAKANGWKFSAPMTKKAGWEPGGQEKSDNKSFTHPDHKGHILTVYPNGEWVHSHTDGSVIRYSADGGTGLSHHLGYFQKTWGKK